MSFVNRYQPPAKAAVAIPSWDEPYDLNFCFPVKELENDLVKLVPFVVRSVDSGMHIRVCFHT